MSSLLSPMILFFLLGAAAALVRSDLSVPEAIAKGLTIYLMIAIGLKGGVEVAAQGPSVAFLLAALAGVALSFVIPLPIFWALRTFGRLSKVNAGAVSAHYGSVSVVTFVTGSEVLTGLGMPAAGFMVAVLALMETPAIVTGLMLARSGGGAVVVVVGATVVVVVGAGTGSAGTASSRASKATGVLSLSAWICSITVVPVRASPASARSGPPDVAATRPLGAATATSAERLIARARRATRGELVVLGGVSVPDMSGGSSWIMRGARRRRTSGSAESRRPSGGPRRGGWCRAGR